MDPIIGSLMGKICLTLWCNETSGVCGLKTRSLGIGPVFVAMVVEVCNCFIVFANSN